MKNKKWMSLALAGMMLLGMAACGDKKAKESSSSPEEETEGYTFETVYTGGTEVHLAANETRTYNVNKDITGRNYIRIQMKTNANMLGKFTYQDVKNAANVVEEEFFIEPSTEEIEFKQFLDSYRENGVGLFDKKLISVTLKNLDAVSAAVTVFSIDAADRDIPKEEKELYIEQGELKVGADLTMGGTLSYLERTSWAGTPIREYVDQNDNVCIGMVADESDVKIPISDSVNLINIYDAGREIQQSYYANVGGTKADTPEKVAAGDGENAYSQDNKPDDYGSNGYDRAWSYTAHRNGYYWPYNPVQGGDEVCNCSQIIDYEVEENRIYVKVRAMDWANGNAKKEKNHPDYEKVKYGRTTKSYIENWYTIKNNMLFVDNRFVDWNGFTDMDSIPMHSMEMPATYISHPLYRYVCYTGNNAWDLEDTNYHINENCTSWVENADRQDYHPEDWFAWVNDQNFGVGMYIPNVGTYVSGRSKTSRSITEYGGNRDARTAPMATKYRNNKREPFTDYDSCYVGNTSYTAPVVVVQMKEYIPLSYSYVVAVDTLSEMRASFKEIYESQTMLNEGLKAWD
ncbi:MAG: hypothetical protein IJX49_00325 [Clostridia bacterium]|nr:hypothetical protein [Clostridia bacterium]